jgi:hypothetical protein
MLHRNSKCVSLPSCLSFTSLLLYIRYLSLFVFERLNRRENVIYALVTFPNLLILTVKFVYQHCIRPLFYMTIIACHFLSARLSYEWLNSPHFRTPTRAAKTIILLSINVRNLYSEQGRAEALWLRHYATNRQDAGSIPNGVIGMFQWQSFRSHYGTGVDSAANINEYQMYFLGVKAAGA